MENLKVGQSFEVRIWEESPYYGAGDVYIGKQGVTYMDRLLTPSVYHKGLTSFEYQPFQTKLIGKLTIKSLK